MKTERYPDFYAVAEDVEEIQGTGLTQYQDPITGKNMGKNRLTWIVHRGDLALEDYRLSQEKLLAFNFGENDERKFTICIYRYLPKDEILPTRVRVRDVGKSPPPGSPPRTHSTRTGTRLVPPNRPVPHQVGGLRKVQEGRGTRVVLPVRCVPAPDLEERLAWGNGTVEQRGHLSSASE